MARNRLLMLAGAIAAAVVVVVVVVVAAGGGSGSSSPTTTSALTSTSGGGTEATSTFAGVPQHGDTLGKPTAAATLVVFEDPQCPYCRQWNIDTLPTVVRDYVRTGRLKVVYRGIVVIDTNSVAGIRAAYAAGRQNKLWQMVEALYERQGQEGTGWITLPLIKEAAREIHADAAKVVKDADSAPVTDAFSQSLAQAKAYGISGTPTFGIQKPLGSLQQLQVGGLDPTNFTAALDNALR
ncbi:MAG: DsbA family protein [Gaiellaceae bacterium]